MTCGFTRVDLCEMVFKVPTYLLTGNWRSFSKQVHTPQDVLLFEDAAAIRAARTSSWRAVP
jgi:hypothetical protein